MLRHGNVDYVQSKLKLDESRNTIHAKILPIDKQNNDIF